MLRHIPNLLTLLRLFMAVAFFVLLGAYDNARGWWLLLDVANALFLLALLTDFFDGFLARRWNVSSAFGRVLDPLVDKIMVLGAFIMLLGDNFHRVTSGGVENVSGVAPWMVLALVLRELLITSLRSSQEAKGQAFGAAMSGKVKMVVQSLAVSAALLYVNHHALLGDLRWAAALLRDLFLYATVLITVVSGLLYLRRPRAS